MAKRQNGSGIWLVLHQLFPPTSPSPSPQHHSQKEIPFPAPIHRSMLRMEKDGVLEQQLKLVEDRSASECCSGCQSGWTHYLDQSSRSLQPRTESSPLREEEEDEADEEDDSSMLSDASSGPPHVHNDEVNCCSSCSDDVDGFLAPTQVPEYRCKRRRVGEEQQEEQSESDSSTVLSISKAITSSSCGSKKLFLMEDERSSCSATQFKEKNALPKRLDYLHSPTLVCRQQGKKKQL